MRIGHVCFNDLYQINVCIFVGNKMVMGIGLCKVFRCAVCGKEFLVDNDGNVIPD